MTPANGQRGFIALMSAIVISAVLLLVAAEGSLGGFATRSNILDAEYKERSASYADACVQEAELALAFDATFVGPEAVSVGSGSCTIGAAENPLGNPRTFPISAEFQNAYTNLLVSIDIDELAVASSTEVGHF